MIRWNIFKIISVEFNRIQFKYIKLYDVQKILFYRIPYKESLVTLTLTDFFYFSFSFLNGTIKELHIERSKRETSKNATSKINFANSVGATHSPIIYAVWCFFFRPKIFSSVKVFQKMSFVNFVACIQKKPHCSQWHIVCLKR